ncbi:MAG TPA: EF-P beta-lysylation protein EpmB [Gammaproteobacteria bacterium]|nr:EF-P beta-lysylation protein EpmB [Gammaproteobacteria bacterium]
MIPELTVKVERHSWQKEMQDTFTSTTELLQFLEIDSRDVLIQPTFPLRVPRTFAKKMEKGNRYDPLLMQVLPLLEESKPTPNFCADPLQETSVNPIPGLLHKFQNRVLLIASKSCAVHCRYCFRKEFPYESNSINRQEWQKCFEYIANDKQITEVILSGGDPLIFKDAHLLWFFKQLSAIAHVRLIRIHTRTPIVIPNRLSPELADILGTVQKRVVIVLHINHPNEICKNLQKNIKYFVHKGITLFNQSVLLKGINDNATILADLSYKMFESHVLPYYLHALDPVTGSAHFQVEDSSMQAIYRELQCILPGYLLPRLVKEMPGLPFKKPLSSFV